MLDINFIRENIDLVKTAAINKKVNIDIDELLQADAQRRTITQKMEELQQLRNKLAAQAGQGKPSSEAIAQGKTIKEELNQLQVRFKEYQEAYETLLLQVPNIPSTDTPIGHDESNNVVLRKVGQPRKFDFTAKEHWQLGETLGVIDNERAAKVSGSRFTYLKGKLVSLEFALIQHALGVLTNRKTLGKIIATANLAVADTPFIPIIPPVLTKRETLHRMARLEPQDDRYYIPTDDLYLVGSAEHTLGAMHMDETLAHDLLPLRYVGFSTSFRREAGSYGKDMRGILRLHQFDKLEMESFTSAELSLVEQDFIVAIQEYLMQSLELPYQVVQICTGDMGGPDARQIDIETWLPGQAKYRETQTSDLMTDFQARRLRTKYKSDQGTQFVHMNDATVFAIGRTLVALLENYQQADGSIEIPAVLAPYLNFTAITPE